MNGDSSRERSETDAAEPRVQEIRIQCFREAEQEVEDEAEMSDLTDTMEKYRQHGPAAFTKHAAFKKELLGGD
jgi:hypothetical protein